MEGTHTCMFSRASHHKVDLNALNEEREQGKSSAHVSYSQVQLLTANVPNRRRHQLTIRGSKVCTFCIMSKQSKRKLHEERGRSIMNNAVVKEGPFKNIIFFKNDYYGGTRNLSDKVMAQLKQLHPYMRDAPGCCSFDQVVKNFKKDTYPQGDLFLWQSEVLTVIHALNISSYPGLPTERPQLLQAESLSDEVTPDNYRRFPKYRREQFHLSAVMLLARPDMFVLNSPDDLHIIDAAKEVCDSRREERARIEQGRMVRYGKVIGSVCSACMSMGKGKMVCSGCERVFYCGRECQKVHWPEHKKDCAKKVAARAAQTK